MPTKKPRVQSLLEPETYEKFKRICENEMRTESQMGGYIIKQFIDNYEKKYGIIEIKHIKMGDNNGTINM